MLELKDFELPADDKKMKPQKAGKPKYRKISGKYIRGPIPLNWWQTAISLPGVNMGVALMPWYFEGMYRGEPFQKTKSAFGKITGLSNDTVERTLTALEKGGLLEITRKKGSANCFRIIVKDEASG